MYYTRLLFIILESFAFILPALPSCLYTRLLILSTYFTLHICKVQYYYLRVKNYYINLEENDENDNKPTPFYGGTKVEPK